MLNSVFSLPQVSVMEQALSAASTRHKVISNNIANVNTPGFKKSEVAFEDRLQEAMGGHKLQLMQTNSRHLPLATQSGGLSEIHTVDSTSMRTDGNNVDIDSEMADLAKNNIYYNAVAQQLSRYFSNLQSAIKEGK